VWLAVSKCRIGGYRVTDGTWGVYLRVNLYLVLSLFVGEYEFTKM
jgi:hypothetical protein